MPIPARFKGIDHVVLRSTDVARTVGFYTDVLGLRVERIFDRLGLHQIRCGANLIDIVPVPEGSLVWRLDPAIFDPNLTPDPPERGWAALAAIACPTLLVRGAESDVISRQTAERFCETVPGCAYAEVAAAGHMVVEDNPDGFNAAVLPFLEHQLLNK